MLDARLRGVEELPFQLDATTVANGDSFTFVTDAGNLDVLGTPSGTVDYDELERTAEDVDLEDLSVKVCNVEDLRRMSALKVGPRTSSSSRSSPRYARNESISKGGTARHLRDVERLRPPRRTTCRRQGGSVS
ncbi:MAG: hypothetical protein ACR2ME_06045 [Acidimicrobiia bacterium]